MRELRPAANWRVTPDGDKVLIKLVNLLPADATIDLGTGDQDVMRFILVVALLLDPAAVLLLLASASTRR